MTVGVITQADIDLAQLLVQAADQLGVDLEPKYEALARAQPTARSLSAMPVIDMVAAAVAGSHEAWREIYERYQPLVLAIAKLFCSSPADIEDVSQAVWLRLAKNDHWLREPAALPRWIAQTARHEALLVAGSVRQARVKLLDSDLEPDRKIGAAAPYEVVLAEERLGALRTALAELSARQRELLLLLVHDPPLTYSEISARIGLPVGSIGPTRVRYLRQLREAPALRAFLSGASSPARHQQVPGVASALEVTAVASVLWEDDDLLEADVQAVVSTG